MEQTPGPWEAGKSQKSSKNQWFSVVFSPTKTGKFHTPRAAEALGVTKIEAEANAQLIAASPELLEACRYVVRYHREHDSGEGELFGLDFVTTCIAAIAKATA